MMVKNKKIVKFLNYFWQKEDDWKNKKSNLMSKEFKKWIQSTHGKYILNWLILNHKRYETDISISLWI